MRLTCRLQLLASFIPKKETVYDIGCDHALLDIFLTLYNANHCFAIDNKESALKMARKNIKHYHLDDKITVLCNDGLQQVLVEEKSIAVLAGMGSETILKILSHESAQKFKRIIVQTNHDYERLRGAMSKRDYQIVEEEVLLDKNIFYIIMVFEKGRKKYTKYDLRFGPLLKKKKSQQRDLYYQHLIDAKTILLKKIPRKYLGKKLRMKQEILWLKKRVNFKEKM